MSYRQDFYPNYVSCILKPYYSLKNYEETRALLKESELCKSLNLFDLHFDVDPLIDAVVFSFLLYYET